MTVKVDLPSSLTLLPDRRHLDLHTVDAVDAVNEENKDEHEDDLVSSQNCLFYRSTEEVSPSTSIASSLLSDFPIGKRKAFASR